MNAVIEFDVTDDVLTRLESQQTPLRIQGHQQSYYVLTMEQLLALMQPAQNFADDPSFSPEDFGLTEADVRAYLARRHERQQKLGSIQPTQLPADLQQRLERLRALTTIASATVSADDQAIQALETAMLRSLETTIQTMSH